MNYLSFKLIVLRSRNFNVHESTHYILARVKRNRLFTRGLTLCFSVSPLVAKHLVGLADTALRFLVADIELQIYQFAYAAFFRLDVYLLHFVRRRTRAA